MTVTIDGVKLSIEGVVRVARLGANGRYEKAVLSSKARENIAATRAFIDQNWMHDDAPLMYSFNTGVGLFKDQRVLMADMAVYQTKSIYAHATGIGEPLDEDIVRATMLLRANAFASNYSGPRVEVVDRLLDFLNKGLIPVIPAKGSVGASGDLAPLAHLSGALCGFPEAEIFYKGKRMAAREAIKKAGLEVDFVLHAKDASALINGSTVSLAIAVLALYDGRRIRKAADIGMALSLEAMRGELAAFDARVHKARPHEGQRKFAKSLKAQSAARRRRVKRCIPMKRARRENPRHHGCRMCIRSAAPRKSMALCWKRLITRPESSRPRSIRPPIIR